LSKIHICRPEYIQVKVDFLQVRDVELSTATVRPEGFILIIFPYGCSFLNEKKVVKYFS